MRSTDELHDKYYDWICSMADDPENDVTADFESADPNVDADILATCANNIRTTNAPSWRMLDKSLIKPKSELDRAGYARIRSYGSKSGIVVIKDTYRSEYGGCLDTQIYDAFVIDAVDDVLGVFLHRDSSAIADIKSATSIMCDLASVIWLYAREPICSITVIVGDIDILTMPVYSFPFFGLPKTMVPMLTLTFQSFRLEFNPQISNISINQRGIMVKNGLYDDLGMKMTYIPGYDAIAASGMWARADEWRQCAYAQTPR